MEKGSLNIKISNYTTNEGTDTAELTVYGVIGGGMIPDEDDVTKENIKAKLDEIRGLDVDEIIVNISSAGGNVDDSLVIYDLLRANKATVKTKISGYTASAATVIAMAGDEISMSENALFLIHRARTMALGSVNDMESVIKDLEKTDERISNIYSNKGGKDQAFYMEWMAKENGNGVWLSASEVKDELGLINSIDKQEYQKAAHVTADQIKNLGLPVPESLKNKKEKGVQELTIKARLSDETKEALNRIENASKEFENMQDSKKESKTNGTPVSFTFPGGFYTNNGSINSIKVSDKEGEESHKRFLTKQKKQIENEEFLAAQF